MKRYDIGEYDSGMIPHSDGDWVKYEDVARALTVIKVLSQQGNVGSPYYGQTIENLIRESINVLNGG